MIVCYLLAYSTQAVDYHLHKHDIVTPLPLMVGNCRVEHNTYLHLVLTECPLHFIMNCYLSACALDASSGITCILDEPLQYIGWQRRPRILSFCLKSSTFFAWNRQFTGPFQLISRVAFGLFIFIFIFSRYLFTNNYRNFLFSLCFPFSNVP